MAISTIGHEAHAGDEAELRQAPGPVHPGPPSLEQAPAPETTRPQQSEAQRLIAEASYLFRIGDRTEGNDKLRHSYFDRAEELALKALDLDENIAQGHFLLFAVRGRRVLDDGVQVTEVWQFPQLKGYLSRTLELDPDHAHALAAKGGLLLDLPPLMGGDPPASVEILERALELNPSGLRTRVTLARALMQQDRTKEAEEQLLTAAHHACIQRRGKVLSEADKLLAEIAETAEVTDVGDRGDQRAPWEPRHADAATVPAETH